MSDAGEKPSINPGLAVGKWMPNGDLVKSHRIKKAQYFGTNTEGWSFCGLHYWYLPLEMADLPPEHPCKACLKSVIG